LPRAGAVYEPSPTDGALRQPELGIDFKRYFTLPTAEVYYQIQRQAARRCCLRSPYLEHLSTRFHAYQQRLALPEDRVLDCIAEVGNTSAASLPIALAHAHERGQLMSGRRVLLSALGAGLTWGAVLLEWPREGDAHS